MHAVKFNKKSGYCFAAHHNIVSVLPSDIFLLCHAMLAWFMLPLMEYRHDLWHQKPTVPKLLCGVI